MNALTWIVLALFAVMGLVILFPTFCEWECKRRAHD